jgi:hypothetical protein
MTAPSIGTPVGRWAGLGPYYAMFPVEFAFQVVREYCPANGHVFDPFAGRGSSIYAAAAQDRGGLGIELNPVGWVYSQAKLHPASEGAVLRRLQELGGLSAVHRRSVAQQARHLPEFFHFCYAPRVLRFLLTARRELCWQTSQTDATLMAILLVYLHAKAGGGLSNQMRQSKAMSPPYAVRWWREHGTEAPDVDPVLWLKERIEWRYATGLPSLHRAGVWLGDSTRQASQVTRCISRGHAHRFNLLFTSPPYFAITNYQYDQWLRLWLLGGAPYPVAAEERSRGRFESKVAYRQLMQSVFSQSAPLLRRDAVIYVRTDAREFTRTTSETVLREVFPDKQIEIKERPYSKTTQTSLFGDKSSKPGEVDMVLTP